MGVLSNLAVVGIVFVGAAMVFRKYQETTKTAAPGTTTTTGACGGSHQRSDYDTCYCSGGQMYCSRNGSSCMMSSCSDPDLDCCSVEDTESELTQTVTCTADEKNACAQMQATYGTGYECKPNSNCVCGCTARSNMAKAYAVNRHGRTILDPRPRRDRVVQEYNHTPIPTKLHQAGINTIEAYRQNPAISISYTDPPGADINNDLQYDSMDGFEFNPTANLPMRMNIFTGATMKALTGTTSAEQANEHSYDVGDNKLNMVWFGRTKMNAIYRKMSPIVG